MGRQAVKKTAGRAKRATNTRQTPRPEPVRKKTSARRKSSDPSSGAAKQDNGQAPPQRTRREDVASHRARMQLVGDLLRSSFEQLAGEDLDQCSVGRGAYLQLMAQVFEVLNGLSKAIPLKTLTVLSKIVADQRRAETAARKIAARRTASGKGNRFNDDRDGDGGGDGDGEREHAVSRRLPERFGEIVRDIYGVTLVDDLQTNSEAGRS